MPVKTTSTKKLFPQAKKNVSLAPYTTFGLGGRAEYLLVTRDPQKVVTAIQTAKKNNFPYYLMGGGSNIICNDQSTIKGLVVVYDDRNGSSPVEIQTKGRTITCACCLPLSKLVALSIAKGFAGLESLTDIPGTVGGALVGNAGAYGHAIAETLDSVLIFDGLPARRTSSSAKALRDKTAKQEKTKRWISRKECQFSYRDSIFKRKNYALLSAKFKFNQGDKKDLQKMAASITADRLVKYGHSKSPGSFFKNILVSKVSKKSLALVDQTKIIDGKIPTGYLLATVGAKGMKLGGLKIADYHGNLIINQGGATFRDVTNLVKILKDRVYTKFGIKLEEEVRYMI